MTKGCSKGCKFTQQGSGQGGKGGRAKGEAQGKGWGYQPPAGQQQGSQRQPYSKPDSWTKQLQTLQKKLEWAELKIQEGLGKLDTQVQGAAGSRSEKPEVAAASNKPKVLDNKGVLREIAWTCKCGQPHWSHKAKVCVACKQDKAANGIWTQQVSGLKSNGQDQTANSVTTQSEGKRKLLSPFNSHKLVSAFQRLGLLLEEELDDKEEEVMEVDHQSPSNEALQEARQKEQGILQYLKDNDAGQQVVQAQEEKVAALPLPREASPSQDLRDQAKFTRAQAQLVDSNAKEKAKQQGILTDMRVNLAKAQQMVQEQERHMLQQEEDFARLHKACVLAVAKTQSAANVPIPVEQQAPPPGTPTPVQVTSAVLSKQLAKAEADPRCQGNLELIRYVLSMTLHGAEEDEQNATKAAERESEGTQAEQQAEP